MTLENIARRAGNDADTRRLLQMAFQQTRMAMCVTDPHEPDNPIVAINRAFTELTGYEEEEILGRNCRFLQGADSDPDEVARIRAAVERRELGYFELLNYRKDGTPFWNALQVGPIFSEDGRLLFYFGSQWDVTGKVETLRALQGEVRLTDARMQAAIDENNGLRQALDQANEAVILTEYDPIDEPGPRIVWVSQGFERMTGYPAEDVIGRNPRMFQGPGSDREGLDRVRRSLEAGKAMPAEVTVNYKKDGTPFYLEWSISPVGGPNGGARHWLSLQRDVTERVEATRKLSLLTDELNHRHKNVLAVVFALQNILPTEGLSAREYRDALNDRMKALGAAHDVVFSGDREGASVATVAAATLAPFASDRLRIGETDAGIGALPALDLALILHELATNAAKHGALSTADGFVDLAFEERDGAILLDWVESGGPPVSEPSQFGFGYLLLESMAQRGGRDDAGLGFAPEGLTFRAALMDR